MSNAINTLSAISLFVEDLASTKDFYARVFEVPIVYEDESSAVAKFENLVVNLLKVENAAEIIEPGLVAPQSTGSRFQISIWVKDVDSVCSRLRREGVSILTGPRDRPWGLRTANFVDPAGHSWEVAQQLTSETELPSRQCGLTPRSS
jgi:catechol 2,3-dioxygenase-like lactoylglutathione lyase family enzyme